MATARSLPGRPARPTILVVDDDAALCESLDLILGDRYHVRCAGAGRAALAVLASEQIDAILLDILLPDVDGLEVLREIRASGAHVPVVMVTGVRTVVTAVEAMRLGAFDYVTKPFDDEAILDVVSRALADGERRHGAASARRAAGRVACLVLGGSPGWRAALRLVLDRRGIDMVTEEAAGGRLEAELARVRAVVLGPGREAEPLAEDVRRRQALGPAIVAMAAGGGRSAGPNGEPPEHVARVVERVEHSIGRGPSATPISRHVSRGVEYFAAHYAEGVTLTSVADVLGISESHFAHTFQSEIGVAPKLFLTRLRLDVAAALLADGRTMSDVARRVGLFDGPHLSRLLRQHAIGWRMRGGRRPASDVVQSRRGDPPS
jgi:DNA-binding response OmpR family regulator/AraC-like DNA-binding protein